jgi:hypothetical protein
MQLDIGLAGAEDNQELLRSLEDWIRQEKINDLQASPKSGSPAVGRMGADLATVLSVVLGAPAVVALVKCLQSWVAQRRPKARVELITKKVSIVIDTENMPDTAMLIDHVIPLLKAAGESK